jgi:hypothetical protein
VAITFTCTCGKALEIGDEYAGQQGTCANCGRPVQIPSKSNGQITGQAPPARPSAKPPPWDERPARSEPASPAELGNQETDVVLMTHAGLAIAEDDDFFVQAPPGIGQVLSAHTTLKKHQREKSLINIILFAMALLVVVVGLIVTVILVPGNGRPGGLQPGDEPWLIILTVIIGLGTAAVFARWIRFVHTCTYVGKKGIAVFQCSFRRSNLLRSEVMHFEDAVEVRTIPTRQFMGGIIGVDEFAYTWLTAEGEVIFRVIVRRPRAGQRTQIDEFYHFGVMAERAWTEHLARDIEEVIEDDELLYFQLQYGDYVQVGNGRLLLMRGGQPIELPAGRIAKVAAGENVITIWEVGAPLHAHVGPGIHMIGRHDLANAEFFLVALEKLLGVRV